MDWATVAGELAQVGDKTQRSGGCSKLQGHRAHYIMPDICGLRTRQKMSTKVIDYQNIQDLVCNICKKYIITALKLYVNI